MLLPRRPAAVAVCCCCCRRRAVVRVTERHGLVRYRSVPGLGPSYITLHTHTHTHTNTHAHTRTPKNTHTLTYTPTPTYTVLESRWRDPGPPEPSHCRDSPHRSKIQFQFQSPVLEYQQPITYLTCPPKPQAPSPKPRPRPQAPPPVNEPSSSPSSPASLLPAPSFPASQPPQNNQPRAVCSRVRACSTIPHGPSRPTGSQAPRSKVPKVEAEAAVALRATCLLPSRVPISTRTIRLLTLLHLHSTFYIHIYFHYSASTSASCPATCAEYILLWRTHPGRTPSSIPSTSNCCQGRLFTSSSASSRFSFSLPTPRTTHAGTQAHTRTRSLGLTSFAHCVCCLPTRFVSCPRRDVDVPTLGALPRLNLLDCLHLSILVSSSLLNEEAKRTPAVMASPAPTSDAHAAAATIAFC